METVSQPVDLLRGTEVVQGHLRAIETGAGQFRVEVEVCDGVVAAEAEDCFEALLRARRLLEAEGLLVCVVGARKDVWPSGMARSMSGGLKAYRMELGKQARKSDLVAIFVADREVATIAEQEAYKRAWFESLGQ